MTVIVTPPPSIALPGIPPWMLYKESIPGYRADQAHWSTDRINRVGKWFHRADGYDPDVPYLGRARIHNLLAIAPYDGHDAAAAINAYLTAHPGDYALDGGGEEFTLSSAGLVYPAGSRPRIQNARFNCAGDQVGLQATGVVEGAIFDNVYWRAEAHTTVGRRLLDLTNFTRAQFLECRGVGTDGKTDILYFQGNGGGTAPYYAKFYGGLFGNGRYAVNAADNGAPASGANANRMYGTRFTMPGRTAITLSRYTQDFVFTDIIIESAAIGILTDGIGTIVRGGWLENVTNPFYFGSNQFGGVIDDPYVSGWTTMFDGVADFERNVSIGRIRTDTGVAALMAKDVVAVDGWYKDDVPADEAFSLLPRLGSSYSPSGWVFPRPGSLLGIVVKLSAARAAGTLTVTAFKNDVQAAAAATINTATVDGLGTKVKGLIPFATGDVLDLRLSTDSGWLPTTADLRAVALVEI